MSPFLLEELKKLKTNLDAQAARAAVSSSPSGHYRPPSAQEKQHALDVKQAAKELGGIIAYAEGKS